MREEQALSTLEWQDVEQPLVSGRDERELAGVVQLLDSLGIGGMERIAVDVANHLPEEQYRSFICATRTAGPLLADLAPETGFFCLERKHRFDVSPILEFVSFIKQHEISIVHAHNSALFVACLAGAMAPSLKVVWHCHSIHSLPALPYMGMVRRAQAVIVVNDDIRNWVQQVLRYPAGRIYYIPNFAALAEHRNGDERRLVLPGTPGKRIVCVASLYPLKDQLTLIRAMPQVLARVPDAHLLLAGADWPGSVYANALRAETAQLGLENNVSFLGVRRDVPAILLACDIGVLSSISEGLPVALLEYGAAGLGVVCTRVGQAPEVLDEGRAGILIPPQDTGAMASALVAMLVDSAFRRQMGDRLQQRVHSFYSLQAAISKICSTYEAIAGARGAAQ